MAKKKTFHEWYCELYELAKKNGYPWLILPEEVYPHDGYDEELDPGEELADLISYGH